MARYYTADKSTFIGNKMFVAPWEMASRVIAKKDAENDSYIKEANLLNQDLAKMKHLNFEEENNRVKVIQEKYLNSSQQIVDDIYSGGLDSNSYRIKLRKLRSDFIKDKGSGDIFKVEQRALAWDKWTKDNKDFIEKSPDEYNKMKSKNWENLVLGATKDNEFSFSGRNIVERPDINDTDSRELFKNIVADIRKTVNEDGTYFYKGKNITKDRVGVIAMTELMSDPKFDGYVDQMGSFLGEKGYFDEKGRKVPMFKEEQYIDKNGKEQTRMVANYDNAFYNDIVKTVQTYAHSDLDQGLTDFGKLKTKFGFDSARSKQDYKESLGLQKQKGEINKAEKARGFMYNIARDNNRKENQKDLLWLRAYVNDENNSEKVKEMIDGATPEVKALASAGFYNLKNNNSEHDYNITHNPQGDASAGVPGTPEYFARMRIDLAKDKLIGKYGSENYDFKVTSTVKNISNLPFDIMESMFGVNKNAKNIAAEETVNVGNYIEFLDGRKSSTDTAKEFLEAEMKDKGIKYDYNTMNLKATARRFNRIYSNKLNSEYRKQYSSTESDAVHLDPIGKEYADNLINEYIANPQGFMTIDALTGKRLDSKIESLGYYNQVYAFAANQLGEVGFTFRNGKDNKSTLIIPREGNVVTESFSKYIAKEGSGENSVVAKSIENMRVNNIATMLKKSKLHPNGSRITNYFYDGHEVVIEQKDDGSFTLLPEGSVMGDEGINSPTLEELVSKVELAKVELTKKELEIKKKIKKSTNSEK